MWKTDAGQRTSVLLLLFTLSSNIACFLSWSKILFNIGIRAYVEVDMKLLSCFAFEGVIVPNVMKLSQALIFQRFNETFFVESKL